MIDSPRATLETLPADLQREIADFCTGREATLVSATCRALNEAIAQDDRTWERRYDQSFAATRDHVTPAQRRGTYVQVAGVRKPPQHLARKLYAWQSEQLRDFARWLLERAADTSGNYNSYASRLLDSALACCADFPRLAAECDALRTALEASSDR